MSSSDSRPSAAYDTRPVPPIQYHVWAQGTGLPAKSHGYFGADERDLAYSIARKLKEARGSLRVYVRDLEAMEDDEIE